MYNLFRPISQAEHIQRMYRVVVYAFVVNSCTVVPGHHTPTALKNAVGSSTPKIKIGRQSIHPQINGLLMSIIRIHAGIGRRLG